MKINCPMGSRLKRGIMSQPNKDQILERIEQSYRLLREAFTDSTKQIHDEFSGARERVITIAVQINSLFLTGWIALLSVGKLDSCHIGYKLLLWLGCGMHIVVFGLIVWSQWKTLQLFFNSSKKLHEIENIARESFKKQYEIVISEKDEDINAKLQEFDKDHPNFQKAYREFSKFYDEENDFAWLLGKLTMGCFFFSITLSLISFIVLIKD